MTDEKDTKKKDSHLIKTNGMVINVNGARAMKKADFVAAYAKTKPGFDAAAFYEEHCGKKK